MGSHSTVGGLGEQAKSSTAYVFTVRDLMADNNAFSEILITAVEIVGLLQLDGMAVTTEQRITRQMIDEGRLTFLPAGSGKQKYFDYRMRRGLKWSPSTCSMSVDIVPG